VTNCAKHRTAYAVAECDMCHEYWCVQCLVPPSRDSGPLRCIECSIVAAGIRTRRRAQYICLH
jgi:hypothetical protein